MNHIFFIPPTSLPCLHRISFRSSNFASCLPFPFAPIPYLSHNLFMIAGSHSKARDELSYKLGPTISKMTILMVMLAFFVHIFACFFWRVKVVLFHRHALRVPAVPPHPPPLPDLEDTCFSDLEHPAPRLVLYFPSESLLLTGCRLGLPSLSSAFPNNSLFQISCSPYRCLTPLALPHTDPPARQPAKLYKSPHPPPPYSFVRSWTPIHQRTSTPSSLLATSIPLCVQPTCPMGVARSKVQERNGECEWVLNQRLPASTGNP